MNNKIVNGLMFVAGAAIGSIITWKVVKTKYEKIANEEITSVKEAFSQRQVRSNDHIETKSHLEEKPSLNDLYAEVLGRTNYRDRYEDNKKEEKNMKDEDIPYVISPDEFDTEDYDTVTFTYYADGVLTDEWGDVIDDEDVEEMVGKDSFNHFGEYEEDAVYVRNDGLKVDYEILKDLAKYCELHPEDE